VTVRVIATSTTSRTAALAMLVSFDAACAQPSGPANGSMAERRVAPVVANAAVTQWSADNFVWLAPAQSSSRLLLLLPGTNGTPANFRTIGTIAAEQGYRVIGLMYPDNLAVVQECANDAAPNCMELMRREIVEGIDVSTHVSVDVPNSIGGRLADLLTYLHRTFPNEGWNTYLDAGAPRWAAIAVGGLSQGGGHAAYIAKVRSVPRVVMFGAPADGYSGQVAPWMQLGATPADRYFGFRHKRDPFTSITPNWLALGLAAFGPETQIDESTSAFDSHMLVTDLLPATGTYADAHPSVFGDVPTPRTRDGKPVFAAAWRYLIGRP
jgi:hypothetical protein